jgi:hypothetical protein
VEASIFTEFWPLTTLRRAIEEQKGIASEKRRTMLCFQGYYNHPSHAKTIRFRKLIGFRSDFRFTINDNDSQIKISYVNA